MYSFTRLAVLTLVAALAVQAAAFPLSESPFDTSSGNISAELERRDGGGAPPTLSQALGTADPYVTFYLPFSKGLRVARVLANSWCQEKSKEERDENRYKDSSWNYPLVWEEFHAGGDGNEAWARDCQIFNIQPIHWRENWFWIQASDIKAYRSWNQQPAIGPADPLHQLDQQFAIECKEVTPDDVNWFGKDCQIVYLSKSRDVDGCLFASGVTDLPTTERWKGDVRAGPCSQDVQGTDSSRFHLFRQLRPQSSLPYQL